MAWVMPVTVVLCDGQPPPFVYRIHRLTFIFHLKTQRPNFDYWQTHLICLRHCDLGGLTLLNSVLLCLTGVHRQYHIYRPLSGIGISHGIFYTLLRDFNPELWQLHWTILAYFRLILGLGSLNKYYTSETQSHNYG
jgi:hypothetical protein